MAKKRNVASKNGRKDIPKASKERIDLCLRACEELDENRLRMQVKFGETAAARWNPVSHPRDYLVVIKFVEKLTKRIEAEERRLSRMLEAKYNDYGGRRRLTPGRAHVLGELRSLEVVRRHIDELFNTKLIGQTECFPEDIYSPDKTSYSRLTTNDGKTIPGIKRCS